LLHLSLSPTSAQPKGPGARPARTLPSAPFSSGAAEKRRIAAAAAAAAAAVRLLQPRTGLAALPPLPPACASQLKAPPPLPSSQRLDSGFRFPCGQFPPFPSPFFSAPPDPLSALFPCGDGKEGIHCSLWSFRRSIIWPFVGAPATNTRQVRPRIPFALPFPAVVRNRTPKP
jgi:hypothetical protein